MTTKVQNIVLRVNRVITDKDKLGNYESLFCEGTDGKCYLINLHEGWRNYGHYHEGDVLYIKSARLIDESSIPSILIFVRINHRLTDYCQLEFPM